MILGGQPLQHVGIRHAKRVIGAAVKLGLAAYRDDVVVVDQPGNRERFALAHLDGELHIQRSFDTCSQSFPIPLQRVTVT